MKASKKTLFVLIFTGLILAGLIFPALPASGRSISLGAENRYTPSADGIYNDVRGFIYVPVGPVTAGFALTRNDRAGWSRWIAEGGAIWEWGGPFYSEARYGFSLDSEGLHAHHGYMDLFYEQGSYYLTGSLRGHISGAKATDSGAADSPWSAVFSFGGAYFGTARNLLNARVYYAQQADRSNTSIAFWNRYRLVSRLDLHNGVSAGVNLTDLSDYEVSLSAGLSWVFTNGWRIGYQLKQEVPYAAGQRTTQHEVFVSGAVPLRSDSRTVE